MLEIKDLHVNVAGKEILKGLSLKVPPGEVARDHGAQRRRQIDDFLRRSPAAPAMKSPSGAIDFYGEDLTGLSPEERAAQGHFPRLPISDGNPRRLDHEFPQDRDERPAQVARREGTRRRAIHEAPCAPRPRS